MYIPKHFKIEDQEQIEKFMADNPFAILITASNGTIAASHLPIRRFNDGKLYGHLARGNPQAETSEADPVYVIFSGPHAYVTPTWYQSDSNLPTWNYSAVHCRGRITFIEDREKVWPLLKEMVSLYEGQTGWRLSEGKGYRRLIPHIRFFEFIPAHIEAQFKFNQNKRSDDIAGVIEGLKSSGYLDVAEFMARITRKN
jgi:transcriptional regulator